MDSRTHLAMSVQDPRQRLKALLGLLSEIEANRAEVLAARNYAIRELHRSGVRITDLVSITGLTRARVNQILTETQAERHTGS